MRGLHIYDYVYLRILLELSITPSKAVQSVTLPVLLEDSARSVPIWLGILRKFFMEASASSPSLQNSLESLFGDFDFKFSHLMFNRHELVDQFRDLSLWLLLVSDETLRLTLGVLSLWHREFHCVKVHGWNPEISKIFGGHREGRLFVKWQEVGRQQRNFLYIVWAVEEVGVKEHGERSESVLVSSE